MEKRKEIKLRVIEAEFTIKIKLNQELKQTRFLGDKSSWRELSLEREREREIPSESFRREIDGEMFLQRNLFERGIIYHK